jgi:hypothetical protein
MVKTSSLYVVLLSIAICYGCNVPPNRNATKQRVSSDPEVFQCERFGMSFQPRSGWSCEEVNSSSTGAKGIGILSTKSGSGIYLSQPYTINLPEPRVGLPLQVDYSALKRSKKIQNLSNPVVIKLENCFVCFVKGKSPDQNMTRREGIIYHNGIGIRFVAMTEPTDLSWVVLLDLIENRTHFPSDN